MPATAPCRCCGASISTCCPGETVLLLGANGAGKTTFLKSLVGLIEARRGHIKLGGDDVTRMRSSDRMRLGMT
jgi:branched-chain amino acid transport system ATP-binding protein